jgi:dTDP-4-amino-4,6-dideoxygalactose transaminase
MNARNMIVAFGMADAHKAPAVVDYCARPDGAVSLHRARLVSRYRERLAKLACLAPISQRPGLAFMPVVLPADVASRAREVVNALALQGIAACVIPAEILAQSAGWAPPSQAAAEAVTDMIAARVLALPLSDFMHETDVDEVAEALTAVLSAIRARRRSRALGLTVAVCTGAAA